MLLDYFRFFQTNCQLWKEFSIHNHVVEILLPTMLMKRSPVVSWQLNTEVTIPLFPLPATWIRITWETFWWIWIIIRMICPFPRGLFKKKFKITSNLNLLLMTFMINHWNFPQWHKCSWGVKRSLKRSQWWKDLSQGDIWYHLGDVGGNVYIF